MTNTTQNYDEFLALVNTIGPVSNVIPDGNIYRFTPHGHNSNSAFYQLHPEFPTGTYGDWRDQDNWCKWGPDQSELTPEEVSDLERRMKVLVKEQREQRDANHQTAKGEAQKLFDEAVDVINHPYLEVKRVKSHSIRQVTKTVFGKISSTLIIPIYQPDGDIWSVQFITESGNKKFMKGGKIKGGFYIIGMPSRPEEIVICEGFATGASIYQVDGIPTVCAFNSGNLIHVAMAVKSRYPNASIIIAGDNDQWGDPPNAGLDAASKAADAVGGRFVVPNFEGLDTTDNPTDFNDQYLLTGEI